MYLLLAESSRAISQPIKLMLHQAGIRVLVASDISSTKVLVGQHREQIFLCLSALNLDGSGKGEAVDYLLSQELPVVVFTSTLDEEIYERLRDKPIIDFIVKDGADSLLYAVSLVRRIESNRHHGVLLIDDARSNRMWMRAILEPYQYPIYEAEDAESGYALLKRTPSIKVIITDHVMPGMDGLELARRIRKTYPRDELCVIAATAAEMEFINSAYLRRGANALLKRPFQKEDLVHTLFIHQELLEHIREARWVAERDLLTNLPNRRFFFEHMSKYYRRAVASKERFALAMLDIDRFKQINDTCGHDVGDLVTQHLARVLEAQFGSPALAARMGGEEFCVVLKGVEPEEATAALERCLARIRNEPVECNGHSITYTASAGLATAPSDGLDEMIKSADTQLYHAKRAGRDRVMVSLH